MFNSSDVALGSLRLRATRFVALIFVSITFYPVYAQVTSPRTITIRSSWGGLGKPSHSELVIQRIADHYAANGRTIPREQVQALQNAIEEPRLDTPNVANLGLARHWLRDHAEESGKYATYVDYESGSEEQKNLFQAVFTDNRTIQRRLNSIYASSHTDDYPHMVVELVFDDQTTLAVTSNSQHPYMIPWTVSRREGAANSYNANISRAIFALLPSEFTNREALTAGNDYSDGLMAALAQATGSEVENRWETLGAKSKAGDAIRALKRDYEVRRSDVNSYHGLGFGKEWKDGNPQEENLQADLWHPGFPQGFVVAAVLMRHDGKVEGADVLAERAARYEQLVLSIGWLRQYWSSNPKEHARMFYVHGVSFTDKAMRIFAADMKAAGHEDLIQRVRAVQNKVVLLETSSQDHSLEYGNGDYWIILPDKSMVLWRWQSMNNVLMWKPKVLSAKECSDYGTVTGGCSGIVVSPEGKIIS